MTIARRRGMTVAAIGLAAVAPAPAAAAPGWTANPGAEPATIDGYAGLDRVAIDRDGAARVYASIDDPSRDDAPLRPVVVTRSAAGEWSAPTPGTASAGRSERGQRPHRGRAASFRWDLPAGVGSRAGRPAAARWCQPAGRRLRER